MGVAVQQPMPTTTAKTTTSTSTATTTSRPQRPGLITSDGRGISYKSKTGRTLTFEFKPNGTPGGEALAKLTALKAALPEVSTSGKKDGAVKKSHRLPEKAEIVVRTKDATESAEVNPGILLGIYDTLSFWCMEAVEVACWGPYDEAPPKTPAAELLKTLQKKE